MELTKFLAVMAAVLPVAYGAPVEAAAQLHPEVLAAMKRDLGLDAEAATARIARELSATAVIDNIKRSTGDDFAGAWVARDGTTVHVGITNEARAAEVEAAGATAVFMRNSLTKLEQAKKALDAIEIDQVQTLASDAEPVGVAAYYVDVASNKLIVEALPASVSHAEGLAAQVGLAAGEFKVVTVQQMPTTLATIRGGDAYYINRAARCSIGFSVTTGFVSAGHCGSVGNSATTSAGAALGTFSGSVFPGSADMSYIRSSSGNTLSPTVAGSSQSITGSTVTAVGGSICRSGSTTGVHCGSVRALGATVNYSEGRVTGLTQTNVCAEPGDSGGSFYSGSQAQGVTSGGSGDCSSGGTTYFQPVGEILSTYGLTLVRA